MRTVLWLEAGSCSGESMAIVGAGQASEHHTLAALLESCGLELLWHPSLSLESPHEIEERLDPILRGERELFVLCVDGSVLHGPNGTGMFDRFLGRPKRDLIAELADKATHVVAMGTCAAFGGIPAAPPNHVEATGLQWTNSEPGGLLPPDWRSRGGMPVLNLAGCPTDPATMVDTLRALDEEAPLELDRFNRPSLVRPCLSGEKKRCGTADKVGYACYGCVSAKFPVSKSLFRYMETDGIKAVRRTSRPPARLGDSAPPGASDAPANG